MNMHRGFVWAAVFCFCLVGAGCGKEPEKRFDLKGKVVSVQKEQRQVILDHEEIPGFMDAMTMPFNVREEWALAVLAPGQTVEATLVVKGDRSWIEGIRISQGGEGAVTATAKPVPRTGDAVPDFTLINQDGKRIRISQYRGRPLLLTFIYTRCPLPDFCPRMSRLFWEVYQGIRAETDISRKPHLLSVSFDTEHDSPAVLKAYGSRYMNPPDFDTWEFATGSPEEIREITGYFGLVYRKEADQITHSLQTALIGPDGRIQRIYEGNQWTSSQVLAEFRRAR